MRQLFWVIIACVVVLCVAVFAMLNHQSVVVDLLIEKTSVHLITALVLAFATGVVTTLLLLAYPLLRMKWRCHLLAQALRNAQSAQSPKVQD